VLGWKLRRFDSGPRSDGRKYIVSTPEKLYRITRIAAGTVTCGVDRRVARKIRKITPKN
jgi:hypothetical protein